jgi:hypothetical protein
MPPDNKKSAIDFDRRKFEDWLKTQPSAVCAAIAARAVQRVLPLGARKRTETTSADGQLILLLFRTTALAQVSAAYPA